MGSRLLHRVIPAALALCAARVGAAESIITASSDEHAWFIVEHDQGGCELRHLAADSEGPFFDRGLALRQVPEAMAAWGDQLWLALLEKDSHQFYTVEVVQNPATQGWFHQPADRLAPVAAMETPGTLCGFQGTARGPVALIQTPALGGQAPSASLMRLRGGRWDKLPLPADLDPAATLRLAAGGAEGQILMVLEAAPGAARTNLYVRDPERETWSRHELDLHLDELRSATRVGNSVALFLEGPRAGACRIAYARPVGLLPLAEFSIPEGQRCAVTGMRGSLLLIEEDRGDESWGRRIDPLAGESGPRQRLSPRPLLSSRMLHWPLLAAALISGLMVVLLLGPRPGGAVSLPAGMAPLGVLGRLAALLADWAIAGAVVVLVLRCSPADVVRSPLITADLGRSLPFFLTAGLTVVLGTAGELFAGRSPGKALMGARVVAADGSRPTAMALLVRNALKALVILIPVLAVIALLSPNAQGVNDLVARTVVVRQPPAPPKDR